MTQPVWPKCGHPRTDDNTIGKTAPRCKKCRRRADLALRRKRALAGEIINDSTCYSRESLGPAAAIDNSPHEENMRLGSHMLLRALWKRHAPIMRFAEAAGRLVVRP